MKLSEIKNHLEALEGVSFKLEDGSKVPEHFHVTEVGVIQKRFIDCGGTVRNEEKVGFQLWTAEDYDHRLSAQKLKSIIRKSEQLLILPNAEIEVEYQSTTIGKYHLDFDGESFILTSTQTDCLAKESCGVPVKKPRIRLSTLSSKESACAPGSGCC